MESFSKAGFGPQMMPRARPTNSQSSHGKKLTGVWPSERSGWLLMVLFVSSVKIRVFKMYLQMEGSTVCADDVEKFLPTHPGGSNSIVRMIGLDATRYFFGADRSQLRMTMMRGGDRASVVSASGSGGGTDDAASLARRRTQGRGRRVKTADSASGSMARAREPTPPKTKGASGAGGIADLRREAAVADTHAHSRFAQHLLNEMVVGRVRQEEAAEVSYLDLARTVGNYGVLSIGRRLSSGKQSVDGSTVQTGDTMERGAAATAAAGTPGGPKKRPPLSMSKFRHFAVGSRTMVATDSMQRQLWRINVLLPNEDDEARFRPGESIHFQFVGENKKIVTRAYTPVRVVNVGSIDFIVKNYNGEMTTHLMTCQTIRMRGPVMNVDIASPHTENKLWKKLGLIAAGTGLTPMLLIIDYYLMKAKRDPATNRPNVQISLLWVNSTETDLFALAELAKMEASACGSLSVVHLLSRPTSAGLSALPELSTLVGTINEEVVAATMPRPVVTSGLRNAGGAGSANSGTWNRMAAQGAATAASTQGSGIVAEYAIEQSLQRAATAASGPAAVQAARENRSSTSGFRPIFGGDELIARRAGTLSRGSLPRNAGGGGGGTGAGVATGTAGGVVPGSGNGGWAGLSPGGGRILMASMSESVPPSVQEDVPGSIIVSGGGGGGLGVPSRVPSFEIGSGAVSVSGWAEGFQPQSSVQASTASSAAPQDAVAIVICGDMLRGMGYETVFAL
ncbi:hypothetical protein DFJ73DRAFT_528474 [Zopfochytrium polystomum]|nr:hypothetical protein DFJ73DRAFT_528474 [Zopfochytrium polystomum]